MEQQGLLITLFLCLLCVKAQCLRHPAGHIDLKSQRALLKQDDDFTRHKIDKGFPYYASIRNSLYDGHHCAGTLISPSWVLTSAWCMDKDKWGRQVVNVSVYIGGYEQEIKIPKSKSQSRQELIPEQIDVELVEIHKKYTNGSEGNPPYNPEYDIALLKLKKQSEHPPVLLDLEGIDDCCEDMELWSVGFGRMRVAGGYATNREAARFPFLSYEDCYDHFSDGGINEIFKDAKNLTEEYSLCVENSEDQCNLDLGAPLVARRDNGDLLVGFGTRGTGECSYNGDPYVFGYMDGYLDWIVSFEDVLSDMSTNAPLQILDGKGVQPKRASSAEVDITKYPYSVSISVGPTLIHECGGVLISPKYILTSARCVIDSANPEKTQSITIFIGKQELNSQKDDDSETIELDSQSVIKRTKKGVLKRDIVLIRLDKASKHRPVLLPVKTRNCCKNSTILRFIGYGDKSRDSSSFSTTPQGSEIEFLPIKECRKRADFSIESSAIFCAGDERASSTCRGDEGSPLLFLSGENDILIGIATAEYDPKCAAGISQFYKISYFMNWINKYISDD